MPGDQVRQEDRDVGCAPASSGVPAGGCIVARNALVSVVAYSDVVIGSCPCAAVADSVELIVQEAKRMPSPLIAISDDARPLWRAFTGPTDTEEANRATECAQEAGIDQDRSARIGVVGDVGDTAMVGQQSLRCCREIVLLVAGFFKELANAAASSLKNPATRRTISRQQRRLCWPTIAVSPTSPTTPIRALRSWSMPASWAHSVARLASSVSVGPVKARHSGRASSLMAISGLGIRLAS